MDGKVKVRQWAKRMYWLTQLPIDVFNKLKQSAIRGEKEFEKSLDYCYQKYGKK